MRLRKEWEKEEEQDIDESGLEETNKEKNKQNGKQEKRKEDLSVLLVNNLPYPHVPSTIDKER